MRGEILTPILLILSQSPLPVWATRTKGYGIGDWGFGIEIKYAIRNPNSEIEIVAEGFEPSSCSDLERTPYKGAVLPLNYATSKNLVLAVGFEPTTFGF